MCVWWFRGSSVSVLSHGVSPPTSGLTPVRAREVWEGDGHRGRVGEEGTAIGGRRGTVVSGIRENCPRSFPSHGTPGSSLTLSLVHV